MRVSSAALAERLRARLPEIEGTILTRIESVADSESGDPEYQLGLRAAAREALAYAFSAIELGADATGPIPDALLDQARKAARNGIGLDTVLRRYLAGHTVLVDLVIREAGGSSRSRGDGLQRILSVQATLLDRLIAAVAEEHSRALAALERNPSAEAKRARTVERLLAGQPVETPELRYDFAGFHLGVVAAGSAAVTVLRRLASELDRALFTVHRDEAGVWGWLGGRRQLDAEQLGAALDSTLSRDVRLAIGEPGEGLTGWRLTHQQARAAWPLVGPQPGSAVFYSEVATIASIAQDDLLVGYLHRRYLAPLERERDGGQVLRETLDAYFAASRNAASAAAALGVSRQTVNYRIRLVERRVGCSLDHCGGEFEAVLRLDELKGQTAGSVLGFLPPDKDMLPNLPDGKGSTVDAMRASRKSVHQTPR